MKVIEIFRENIQKHKKITWVVVVSYIVFNGCFIFPFSNELFPFNYEKGLIVMIGYGIIGLCFALLLEKRKGVKVFILTFLFTILGMICRYFLEYGEISNTRNFIPVNIILFVVIIPTLCTTIYWFIYKSAAK